MPAEFIPPAEEAGLDDLIGIWSLREACRQLAAWTSRIGRVRPPDDRQRLEPSIDARSSPNRWHRRCATPVFGRTTCLEITETTLIHSLDIAATVLSELRALGVLGLSRQLWIGVLVAEAIFTGSRSTLSRSIGRLSAASAPNVKTRHRREHYGRLVCESTGANVIAEGVETRSQSRQLRHWLRLRSGLSVLRALTPGAAETLIARGPVVSAHLIGSPSTQRPANVH